MLGLLNCITRRYCLTWYNYPSTNIDVYSFKKTAEVSSEVTNASYFKKPERQYINKRFCYCCISVGTLQNIILLCKKIFLETSKKILTEERCEINILNTRSFS